LSPLRLPIPPHGREKNYRISQGKRKREDFKVSILSLFIEEKRVP
jgi:hypothetical protein